MNLAFVGKPSRDKIVVSLTVTNKGDRECGWDKEFAALVSWHFQAEDGTAIVPDHVSSIAQDEEVLNKARFAKLQPKQSLSKDVELTKSFQAFATGHGTYLGPDGAMAHVPTGYEEQVRLYIPRRTKLIRIWAEYTTQSMDAKGGFKAWFGYKPESVGMWSGKCESGKLEARLP